MEVRLAGLPPCPPTPEPRAPTTTFAARGCLPERRDSGAHTRLVPRGTLTLILCVLRVNTRTLAHRTSANQKKGTHPEKYTRDTIHGVTSKSARGVNCFP